MSEVLKEDSTGEKIKKIRESKGMSQKELAEKRGNVYQTIGKYERGVLNPKITTIVAIAEALEVGIDDILDSNTSKNIQRSFALDTLNKLNKERKALKEKNILFEKELDNKTNIKYNDTLLFLFSSLNDKGKQKAIDYMKDLLAIDLYSKK